MSRPQNERKLKVSAHKQKIKIISLFGNQHFLEFFPRILVNLSVPPQPGMMLPNMMPPHLMGQYGQMATMMAPMGHMQYMPPGGMQMMQHMMAAGGVPPRPLFPSGAASTVVSAQPKPTFPAYR